MDQAVIVFEAVKLIAQFGGAIVVARLTVRWALSRYKSEKVWERQLVAYSDAISGISELRRLNAAWFNDALLKIDRTQDAVVQRQQEYKAARRKVEEAIAIGILLLPVETQEILETLLNALDERGLHNTWEDELEHDGAALKDAQAKLIRAGRPILGTDLRGR